MVSFVLPCGPDDFYSGLTAEQNENLKLSNGLMSIAHKQAHSSISTSNFTAYYPTPRETPEPSDLQAMAGCLTKSIKMVDTPREFTCKPTDNPLSTAGSLQRHTKSDSMVTLSCLLERSLTPPSTTKLQSRVSGFRPESEAAYQKVLASLADQVTGRSIHASDPSWQEITRQPRKETSRQSIDSSLLPMDSTENAIVDAGQNISQLVRDHTSTDTTIAESIEHDDRPVSKRRRKRTVKYITSIPRPIQQT